MKKEFPIVKYDPNFKLYFEREYNRLAKNFGKFFKIYHIGSTAVPNLGGKNILDILLLSPTKKDAKRACKKMMLIGYTNPPNTGDKFRILFKRDMSYKNKKIRVHVHLMWKTSDRYKNYIIFRDYLRTHPKEVKKYYNLKKFWWEKANHDRKKYTKMKAGYVVSVINKAKKLKRIV